MARRELDMNGIHWDVYEVPPPDPRGVLSVVEPRLSTGWLCFESNDGARRRLAPIPEGWERFSGPELVALWARAVPARSSGLEL